MKLKLTREQATQINQWAKSGFAADDEDITSSELYTKLQNSTEIDASCLNFTREGLLLFANIIATSPSLTSLDMSSNGIGANAAAFGTSIATSPSLTTLDMGNNGIGANAAAFGTSIATLDSLTTLDMRYNDIGANEADFIKNIAHLTNLDWLYGCNEAMFGQVKESHLALQTAVKNILSDPLFSSMNEDLASIVVEYLGNMLVDHTDNM